MRTRVLVVGVLLWISTAVQVGAVGVRDIVELSRAGLEARRAAAAAGVLGVGRETTSGHLGPRAAPTGGAIRRRAVRV